MKTVIGLDFGSDSVRAVLVTENGAVLASCVKNYPRWMEGLYSNPATSQFRQHPLDYLECMEYVTKEVLKGQDANAVAGIAIDTTGSTPCAVDADGVPLSLHPEFADDPDAMFVLWKDHTSQAETDRINDVASTWKIDYRMYEGGVYSAEWFWSKVLHILRHSPKVRAAAANFVEHCDWIAGLLAGRTKPSEIARNRCAAGHKAMWHASWGGLPAQDFLSAVDPLLDGWRDRLYTSSQTPDIPIGTLCPEWAERLGLPTTVVIGGGTFDAHVGSVGAQLKPYEMVNVLGTSACNMLAVPYVNRCIPGICGQVDGSLVPGYEGLEGGLSAFGDTYAWFRRLVSWGGEASLADLEKEAAKVAPGAEGIVAVDWFNGRRTPYANSHLTGMIAGLNLGSTAPMVYRALIEATVFGTKAIVDHFAAQQIPVKAMIAIGGISRKSPLVMQIFADVLNMPVKVSACDQACALGAAMFAAVASGLHKDIFAAMDAMGAGFDISYKPNQELVPVYAKLYQRYVNAAKVLEAETMKNVN